MGRVSFRHVKSLERSFPVRVPTALARAKKRALKAGLSVLLVEGNELVRIAPDNSRVVLKSVGPPVKVTIGKMMRLP